ncbi:hypothetical protein RT717_04830 [Imperialibacter roseus]|uniref:DoxX family protein n=1 Tax=Imperialibacter roseus TaxID=1324217 RepID=A0ABZ0ISC1_9BACT|nr:hypothetical protein [Imperialibacter roseus]WOK07953.1 hypothetical protein RT717_04830 [Imperialibacter roseus]
MKTIRTNSILLGSMSLAFGLLKFIDPFQTWYATQIETSGMPSVAYPMGIVGEIVTGLLLLMPWLLSFSAASKKVSLLVGHGSLGIMMIVACYVHLLPDVPADVLPLKIKPPFIPLVVLAYTLLNMIQIYRSKPFNN